MDARAPIKLPPSLHKSLTIAQHQAYLATGKKPTLGALLEAAWESASLEKLLPAPYEKNLIASRNAIEAKTALSAAIKHLEDLRRIIEDMEKRTAGADLFDAAVGIARASAELGSGSADAAGNGHGDGDGEKVK